MTRSGQTLHVEIVCGGAIEAVLGDIARLRMTIFRDFPYLYEGSLAYEEAYLRDLAQADRSICVIARNQEGAIVGASTGLPLAAEAEAFQAPFVAAGHAVEQVFYCAESVLLSAYRGHGLGHVFFDQREAHARQFGDYTKIAFCSVVRPNDHPLRPHGYRPLDTFWQGRGYRAMPGMVAQLGWPDLGEAEDSLKPLQFWMKDL